MDNVSHDEQEFARRLMALLTEAGEKYEQALADDEVDILALPERDTFVYEYLVKYCTTRLIPPSYRSGA